MRHTQETKNQVKQFVDAGNSKAEAARHYNVSPSTVSRWTGNTASSDTPQKIDIGPIIALAARGRDSVIDPLYRKGTLRAIEQPKGQRKFAINALKFDDLRKYNFGDTVTLLINASDALSLAVDTYIDSTVDGFDIVPEEPTDTRSVQIIEDFFKNSPEDPVATLKRLAYGIYVEGGFSAELVTDDSGMPIKIEYVSPFTLTTNRVEADDGKGNISPIGEYDQIVQPTGAGINDYTVLVDELQPNPYFIYNATTIRGNQKLGTSPIEPALFSVASMIDLISMIIDYTQGQVFPKGVYQIDAADLVAAGADADQLIDAANQATKALQGKLDTADITEDVVLATKIVYTLVGSIERANIDGADMIMEILERLQQRALRVPNSLFGGRQRGGGLGRTERHEWLQMSRRIRSVRVEIEDPISDFFTLILRLNNHAGNARLKLTDSDIEYQRILSEAMAMKAKAFVETDKLGIFTKQELREKYLDPDMNFGTLDAELPNELMALPMPSEPMADEPTSEDA